MMAKKTEVVATAQDFDTKDSASGTDAGKVWCKVRVQLCKNYQVIEVESGMSEPMGDDPHAQLWNMEQIILASVDRNTEALAPYLGLKDGK
jgi:hypothetical protein